MSKKNFNDTKLGKFLSKASQSVPEILNVGGKILTGNVGGAVAEIGSLLKAKSEGNEEVKKLLIEFEKEKLNFEKDIYELEVKDRESARNREVEFVRSGRIDWMMILTGIVGLGSYAVMIYAVIWVAGTGDNKLFIHLLGIVEGVVLTIFAYYFGTSKSSQDKNDLIK